MLQIPSMTTHFPGLFYFVWSIPYFRSVLNKHYLLELEHAKKFGHLLTSDWMFKVARAVHSISSKDAFTCEALEEAITVFVSRDNSYRMHCGFDFSKALIDLIILLHLSHRPTDQKSKTVYANINTSQAEILNCSGPANYKLLLSRQVGANLASEESTIESPYFKTMLVTQKVSLYCKQCQTICEGEEQIISINFILMSKTELPALRTQFEGMKFEPGLRYVSVKKAKWKVFPLIKQNKREPISTIYDYLALEAKNCITETM